MKNYISLTLLLFVLACIPQACDKNRDSDSSCDAITLNQAFNARIGEEWCISASGWSITFGPFIEDSRCNVPGIQCVWEGRYVMAATIDNGEVVKDTFYAQGSWTDTLYNGPYTIILQKVYPEIRTSMEALDTTAYSFDILIK